MQETVAIDRVLELRGLVDARAARVPGDMRGPLRGLLVNFADAYLISDGDRARWRVLNREAA